MKKVRDERSSLNGTTFKEFFGKFPALYEIMLHELSSLDLSNEKEMQSSLYSILVLLSR